MSEKPRYEVVGPGGESGEEWRLFGNGKYIAMFDDKETAERFADVMNAVGEIVEAVENEGTHPGFHYKVMESQRMEWPTLWKALDKLIAKARGGKT